MADRMRLMWGGIVAIALPLSLLALAYGAREHTVMRVKSGPRGKLAITVKEGKNWLHSHRMAGTKVTDEPQMAFWLEDTTGAYVATIYVTRKTALQDWQPLPGEKEGEIRRPSALPVWAHKHPWGGVQPKALCSACHGKHGSGDKSTKGHPLLDAITGATPKWGFTREWAVPAELKPGKYVVRAEINHFGDFNDAYREDLPMYDPKYSGGRVGSGQPSILWEGAIGIGGAASSTTLKKVGHGHPAGMTGDVYVDLSTLTSALDIVESIKVKYIPQE